MNLLVHQGALGDWVLTFPILRGLAKLGPTRAVTAGSKAQLAARLIPGLEAIDIERPEFSALHVEGSVSPTLAEADGIVVSFVSDGQDAWAGNARRLATRARLAFLSTRPPHAWTGHVCEWHAAQLRAQGVSLPDVVVPPRAKVGPIVIHPGSGSDAKCWPLDRFEALIDRLLAAGHRVRPLLGEVELDCWPAATRDRWLSRLDARAITSLDGLCDELKFASLLIGNDSGPTHLAAQMGLPTIALFGPTSPRIWAPRGPAVAVLAPPEPRPMDWLPVDRVLEFIPPAR
jgi:ADP-heptose:LPS heptosyltransferase